MLLPVNYFGHTTLNARPLTGASKETPAFAAMYRNAALKLSEQETIPENEHVMYRAAQDADRRVSARNAPLRRPGRKTALGGRESAEGEARRYEGDGGLYREV